MGKDFKMNDGYIQVDQRIAEVREKYPEGRLRPADPAVPYKFEVVNGRGYVTVVAAFYRDENDTLPGIGMALEPIPGRTPFTKDSELQNAETSAWGRAMIAAFCADAKKGIATQEDVRNRTAEELPPVPTTDLLDFLKENVHKTQVDTIKSEWPFKFSPKFVPEDRADEARSFITNWAEQHPYADPETGEVQPSEPNPQERSDEGAGEQQQPATDDIDLPQYEHPLTLEQALEKLIEVFDPYVDAGVDDRGKRVTKLNVKRREAKEIWDESGYATMPEIGAVEWGILMSFARERIRELKQDNQTKVNS